MARPSHSRTRNSILNIVTGLGGQFVSIALKFLCRTVFIHTLGKVYLGVNGFFSDILTLLSLTELGFDTAIAFKLFKPLADGDDKRVRVLMKFYKQAYRTVGTVILVLGIGLIWTLPYLIRDYGSLKALGINAVLIFLLHIARSVSSYWFFAYRSAIMKANQQKYVLDVVDCGIDFVTNVAKILVLLLLKDFVLYTATVIFFNILRNLINATIATRRFPQFFAKEEDNLSRAEIWGLLKDCGALFLYKVNIVVVKATGNTIISFFLGLGYVGLYSNYLLFLATIKSLLDRLYTAVNASMGNLFATVSEAKRYQFFSVMNFLSVILYGTAGLGVALCADELIVCWVGTDYVIEKPFAMLVGLEILFHGLKMNLGQIRNVSGIFRQMWYRPLLSILINLGTAITLVRCWGIPGVVCGILVADLTTNLLFDPLIIHKYGFGSYRLLGGYYLKNGFYLLLLAAIGIGDSWLCKTVLPVGGWMAFLVHILIVSVSVPLLFMTVCWKSDECHYLVHLAGVQVGKFLGKRKAPA